MMRGFAWRSLVVDWLALPCWAGQAVGWVAVVWSGLGQALPARALPGLPPLKGYHGYQGYQVVQPLALQGIASMS